MNFSKSLAGSGVFAGSDENSSHRVDAWRAYPGRTMPRGKKVKVLDTRLDGPEPVVIPLETIFLLLKADYENMAAIYGKGEGEVL